MSKKPEPCLLPVSFRPYEPQREGEQAMVFNNWLKSFRASPLAGQIPADVYYHYHHGLVTKLLDHDQTTTLLATNPQDPDQVYGWINGTLVQGSSALIVNYLYVKHTFRRLSVATRLVEAFRQGVDPSAPVFYTHLTVQGQGALNKREGWYYNPYLLWSGVYEGGSLS